MLFKNYDNQMTKCVMNEPILDNLILNWMQKAIWKIKMTNGPQVTSPNIGFQSHP